MHQSYFEPRLNQKNLKFLEQKNMEAVLRKIEESEIRAVMQLKKRREVD